MRYRWWVRGAVWLTSPSSILSFTAGISLTSLPSFPCVSLWNIWSDVRDGGGRKDSLDQEWTGLPHNVISFKLTLMKFESVISETKAKGEQVWLAFDHNGDQLQLEPKWLDGGIRGPLADYVFLIRVVSICDGCPFYSRQPLMANVMFATWELSPCVCCPLTPRRPLPHLVYTGLVCKDAEWKPQMTSSVCRESNDNRL